MKRAKVSRRDLREGAQLGDVENRPLCQPVVSRMQRGKAPPKRGPCR